MKKLVIHVAAFAAVTLVACSSPEPQDAQPTTTMSSSKTTPSKTTSQTTRTVSKTTEAVVTSEPVAAVEQAGTGDYYPGDPRLIPLNAVSDTVGTFYAQGAATSSGKFYVFCNGGTITMAQGAPVEAGTCSSLVTWDEVNAMSGQFGNVFMSEAEKVFSEMESEIVSEMEASGYATPTEQMPWSQ